MPPLSPTATLKNLACAWLLLCFTWAMPTYAEQADRDKPIDLEADSVIVDDAKQISTYSGNVILSQGSLVIHADTLVVREDSGGFQHSTALGNPTGFKQKIEGKNEYMEGSAKRIEYDGRMDKVQLFGKASVKRGDNIIQGEYISYDANAEYAEVMGGKKTLEGGANSGRVRAIIQPKNKASSPAASDSSKATPATANNKAPAKDARLSRTLQVSPESK